MTKSIIEEVTRREETMPHKRKSTKRSLLEQIKKTIHPAIILVLLPLLLAGGGVLAADPAPQRLTLEEAVKLALKQNPQVLIAGLNVAESQQDQLTARAGLLPQAGFQVSNLVRRANLEAALGRRIPFFPQQAGPFQVFQAGPSFSMPIFDLTLWHRWQASRHSVSATESQETSVREQVVLLTVSQYLGGLRAAAAVQAARSRVELAQALYDQARDLQDSGVGTGLDTLRANVQLQNEKQLLIVAETQRKTALYGLVRLLNLDPQQTVELADEVSFFQTPEFPVAQNIEAAYATRPELKALLARELALQASKKAARGSRLPQLSVAGGWAYQGLSLSRSIPTYQYEAAVSFPLFTSGRIRAEIAKADLELKKVAQQRKDLQDQVALEVKTAVAQLESARNEVAVANLGVDLAKQEVEQARDRFQAGVANNIEAISAQDALARANDNQIGALYRYNQSRADLAHALGQIEKLYAK
jgi:outer membrane protein TolC